MKIDYNSIGLRINKTFYQFPRSGGPYQTACIQTFFGKDRRKFEVALVRIQRHQIYRNKKKHMKTKLNLKTAFNVFKLTSASSLVGVQMQFCQVYRQQRCISQSRSAFWTGMHSFLPLSTKMLTHLSRFQSYFHHFGQRQIHHQRCQIRYSRCYLYFLPRVAVMLWRKS